MENSTPPISEVPAPPKGYLSWAQLFATIPSKIQEIPDAQDRAGQRVYFLTRIGKQGLNSLDSVSEMCSLRYGEICENVALEQREEAKKFPPFSYQELRYLEMLVATDPRGGASLGEAQSVLSKIRPEIRKAYRRERAAAAAGL